MEKQTKKTSLRQLAEAKFKKKRSVIVLPSCEKELKKLLYELQVQKIEIELQNQVLSEVDKHFSQTELPFKSLIENILDLIVVFDLDGLITYSNKIVVGTSLSETIGANIKELMPDDAITASLKAVIDRVVKTGKASNFQHKSLADKNGDVRIYSCQLVPLFNSEGNIYSILSKSTDITKENKAYKALQKKKEQLEKLFESSPDFVLKSDLYTHKFIDVNQRALDYYGYTKEEFLQLSVFDVEVSPLNQDRVKKHQKTQQLGKVVETEGIHQRKDGSTFPIKVHVVKLDDGFIASVRDVTALKKAETQLRESEEYLRKGAEIAQFGFWKFFPNSGKIEGTKELLEIIELQEGFIYDKFTEKIHSDDFVFYRESFSRGVKEGLHWDIKYRLKFDDGRIKWVRSIGEPIIDKNFKVQHVIGTIQDITKEKELSDLKSKFVSTVSHQFRTPLTVIQANIGLLSMQKDHMSERFRPIFEKVSNRINRQITRMTGLMNDILILGKINASGIKPKFEQVDLVALCRAVANSYDETQEDNREINFLVNGTPYEVTLDIKLIEHALSNLISNAFKYSLNRPAPSLSIEFEEEKVCIAIKDSGVGIPPEEMKHIFDPFYRASNVSGLEGTGLGTAIVKEYVELNGGTIDVKSKLNEGAEFIMTLPKIVVGLL